MGIIVQGGSLLDLDSKQKVLLAVYTEYQKDLPEFGRINPESLGLSPEIFYCALKKLRDEELIDDVHLIWGEDAVIPLGAVLDVVKLTRLGINYIEDFFNIKPTLPGKKKFKIIYDECKSWEDQDLSAWLNGIKETLT